MTALLSRRPLQATRQWWLGATTSISFPSSGFFFFYFLFISGLFLIHYCYHLNSFFPFIFSIISYGSFFSSSFVSIFFCFFLPFFRLFFLKLFLFSLNNFFVGLLQFFQHCHGFRVSLFSRCFVDYLMCLIYSCAYDLEIIKYLCSFWSFFHLRSCWL